MLLACILLASFIFMLEAARDQQIPGSLRNVAINPPQPLQAFVFTDHNQQEVNLGRLENHWSFLFFGFTNCPDICPATLSQLRILRKDIMKNPDHIDNLQFLFVSVDPARDTHAHLAEYMAYFDPSFIGMTGKQEVITAFERQLGAYHRYGSRDKHGYYSVQHSAEVYLIDPAGQLTAKFHPPMDIALVSEQFSEFVRLFAGKVS